MPAALAAQDILCSEGTAQKVELADETSALPPSPCRIERHVLTDHFEMPV
jgi:hypothetical protein